MADVMRANGISGGWYAEPYAGGAGVALHLLLAGYVRSVYINDVDPAIYSFWRSVIDYPEKLMERLETVPVTIDERKRQQEILHTANEHSNLDVGFATLFVNRTSRSGILSGGPIGGQKQNGRWKVDARFHRKNLAERIRKIALHRNRIHVSGLDAIEFLDALPNSPDQPGLIYLDPPYYAQGGGLYCNAYSGDDHATVAKYVHRLNRPWIVTYDDTQEIEQLYQWSEGGRFRIYYTANDLSRRHAEELIYYGGIHLNPAPYLKR